MRGVVHIKVASFDLLEFLYNINNFVNYFFFFYLMRTPCISYSIFNYPVLFYRDVCP